MLTRTEILDIFDLADQALTLSRKANDTGDSLDTWDALASKEELAQQILLLADSLRLRNKPNAYDPTTFDYDAACGE